MTSWLLPTRADTAQFGEALGARLAPGAVVALIGDLGAGKTTLVRSVARGLGTTSHVSSPTFGLIHEYRGRIPMFHVDPYRLTGTADLHDLGFHDLFGREGVVIVEWADRVEQYLPPDRIELRLDLDVESLEADPAEDAPRRMESAGLGPSSARIVDSLAADPSLRPLIVSSVGSCK